MHREHHLTITVEVGSEPYGTGENMRAVMRLRGSSKFVGVASVSFCFAFRFVSFLDLLAPSLYRDIHAQFSVTSDTECMDSV